MPRPDFERRQRGRRASYSPVCGLWHHPVLQL
jgi:hypothetical protein